MTDTIAVGDFVETSGGKTGRVDLVVSNGKVPGVTYDVEGTKATPAARIREWKKADGVWAATDALVAGLIAGLKRIAAPPEVKAEPGPAGMALISLLSAHEARVENEALGESAQVTGSAVKAVWDRGLAAYPGEEKAELSREAWAEERVKTFLKVAAGTPVDGYTRDLGLLAKTHPLHPDNRGRDTDAKAILDVKPDGDEGVVMIDTTDLQSMLAKLTAE